MSVNKKIIETEATVPIPEDAFNVVSYTGTGSSLSITLGFEPTLLYFKGLNATGRGYWYYNLNGTWKYLAPAALNTEETNTPFTTSSTGITIPYSFGINYSGLTVVLYAWKYPSSATSNTNGTITSSVQADIDKGISQVAWTGNSSNASIGHSLGGVPELIIAKSRTVSQNWAVYNQTSGSNYWLQLNGSGAKIDEAIWQDTTPTSTLFYVNGNVVINSGNSIAWAFRSIPGLSKIGTYTGTGTSGITVTTDFQPDLVIIKSINNASDWYAIDSERANNKFITLNGTATEYTASDTHTFTSTGFELSGSSYNNSGYTWIYYAVKISS